MSITMDEEALAQVKHYLEEAKREMEESLSDLNELMGNIYTEEKWKGESEKAFMAYLHLLYQYHRCFTDENADNPLTAAIKAFTDLESAADGFYDGFNEYQWLLDIT